MKNEHDKCGGIGFLGALAIAFIILKVCNLIAWPWVVVLAPIWAQIVALFGVWVVARYGRR